MSATMIGRSSRTLQRLAALGHGPPPQTTIKTELVYVTRRYRRQPHHLAGQFGPTVTQSPSNPRVGVVARQDDGNLVVLLAGMLGLEPPTADAGMLAFAESLAGPESAEIVKTASPSARP